jgi:hypothetical protein
MDEKRILLTVRGAEAICSHLLASAVARRMTAAAADRGVNALPDDGFTGV